MTQAHVSCNAPVCLQYSQYKCSTSCSHMANADGCQPNKINCLEMLLQTFITVHLKGGFRYNSSTCKLTPRQLCTSSASWSSHKLSSTPSVASMTTSPASSSSSYTTALSQVSVYCSGPGTASWKGILNWCCCACTGSSHSMIWPVGLLLTCVRSYNSCSKMLCHKI